MKVHGNPHHVQARHENSNHAGPTKGHKESRGSKEPAQPERLRPADPEVAKLLKSRNEAKSESSAAPPQTKGFRFGGFKKPRFPRPGDIFKKPQLPKPGDILNKPLPQPHKPGDGIPHPLPMPMPKPDVSAGRDRLQEILERLRNGASRLGI
jgi:hypothetical protein